MLWSDSGTEIGVFPMISYTDNFSIAKNVNEAKRIKNYEFEVKGSICQTNIIN
jgi:hypothetical protein